MADDLTTMSISEQLAQVADTLAALAKGLHGVADSLRVPPPAADPKAKGRAEFHANDLLSIVSHDLLTPLTAMSGNAALIRQHGRRSRRHVHSAACTTSPRSSATPSRSSARLRPRARCR